MFDPWEHHPPKQRKKMLICLATVCTGVQGVMQERTDGSWTKPLCIAFFVQLSKYSVRISLWCFANIYYKISTTYDKGFPVYNFFVNEHLEGSAFWLHETRRDGNLQSRFAHGGNKFSFPEASGLPTHHSSWTQFHLSLRLWWRKKELAILGARFPPCSVICVDSHHVCKLCESCHPCRRPWGPKKSLLQVTIWGWGSLHVFQSPPLLLSVLSTRMHPWASIKFQERS